jgi:hypothetical protein
MGWDIWPGRIWASAASSSAGISPWVSQPASPPVPALGAAENCRATAANGAPPFIWVISCEAPFSASACPPTRAESMKISPDQVLRLAGRGVDAGHGRLDLVLADAQARTVQGRG